MGAIWFYSGLDWGASWFLISEYLHIFCGRTSEGAGAGGKQLSSKGKDHVLDALPYLWVLVFKQNLLIGIALKDYVVLSEEFNECSLFRPFALSCFSDSNCVIQLQFVGLVGKQSDGGIQILNPVSFWERQPLSDPEWCSEWDLWGQAVRFHLGLVAHTRFGFQDSDLTILCLSSLCLLGFTGWQRGLNMVNIREVLDI